MSRRRLYLDRGPGEDRGVVTLDGRPERLLIARLDDDPDAPLAGRSYIARVARIDRALASAFVDLGDERQALLALSGGGRSVVEGAAVRVEIASEARWGKLAQARWVGPAEGPPRRLDPPQTLIERLRAFAPDAAVIEDGQAREVADEAESAVLAIEHALPGGGSIAIEPTRALTAVDVDLGARGGDARRGARQANIEAIGQAARLLRLKGLGGLVVFDLVGGGQDGGALTEAARAAFAPDEPGVALGPLTRLGTFQLAAPRRVRPLAERLCDEGAGLSAATCALRLLRALEREGRADPGGRLIGRCAPAVVAAASPYREALTARVGPRFSLEADPALPNHRFEVTAS